MLHQAQLSYLSGSQRCPGQADPVQFGTALTQTMQATGKIPGWGWGIYTNPRAGGHNGN